MTRINVLIVAVIVLSSVASAAAQAHRGPPVAVSPPDALGGSLAFDPVSQTGLTTFNGPRGEILARLVSVNGRPIGAPFLVPETRSNTGVPSVGFNATTREYLVVWAGGDGAPLNGRRVAARGAPVGATIPIGEGLLGPSSVPVVLGGKSGYVVVFDPGPGGVHAVVLDALGAAGQGTEVVRRENCGAPTAAYRDRADEFVVGWVCRANGDQFTYYAQRLAESGAKLGQPRVVIPPKYARQGGEVALAYNPVLDQFLFVGGSVQQIRTRRLDGAGQPIGPIRSLRRRGYQLFAQSPKVGFDRRTRRYLVLWISDYRGRRAHSVESLFATTVGQRGLEAQATSTRIGAFGASSVASRGAVGGFLAGLNSDRGSFVRVFPR